MTPVSEFLNDDGDSALSRLQLRCPLCAEHFSEPFHDADTRRLRLVCARGHRFDAARQGYVNFIVGEGTKFQSDTVPMIEARERFLDGGHYEPLRMTLCDMISQLSPRKSPVVIDVGCGTGYYSRGVPYAALLAFDLSKPAVRRAARLPRSCAAVWDAWKPLPVADGTADAVLNVFAPHNLTEFRRASARDGVVVIATAGEGHLEALRTLELVLGQRAGKIGELDAKASAAGLELVERKTVTIPLRLPRDVAADLALMGPAGHHLSREEVLTRLPEEIDVSAVVDVSAYRAAGAPRAR